MTVSLYEFAVIQQPKFDKNGEVLDEARLVVAPTSLLAKSQEQAQMKAVRAIPAEYMEDLDRLSVVVRPFDRPTQNVGLRTSSFNTFGTTNTTNTPNWVYTGLGSSFAQPSVSTTYTDVSSLLGGTFEE